MRLRALLALCALPLLLSACYLPQDFTIDLSMERNGDYTLSYQGYLIQPSIAEGVLDGSLDDAAEQQKVEIVLKDLKRDSAVRQLSYDGRGVFSIVYDRSGNIMREKSFVFVRRNSRILEMFFRADSNTVEIRGGFVPDRYQDRLSALGYQMTGTIELRTTAGIRRHNAGDSDKVDNQNRLRWEIRSVTDPAPNVIIG